MGLNNIASDLIQIHNLVLQISSNELVTFVFWLQKLFLKRSNVSHYFSQMFGYTITITMTEAWMMQYISQVAKDI